MLFDVLRAEVEQLFATNAESVQGFMSAVFDVILDQDSSVTEKFQQLQLKHAMMVVTNLDEIIGKVEFRLENATLIRETVECGDTNNFDMYLIDLGRILGLMTEFRTKYEAVEDTYSNLVSDFDPTIYNKIKDNCVLSPQ